MTIFFCFIFQSKKIEKKNMSSPSDVSPSSLSNIQPIINVPKSKDNHCELDDHLKNILNEHVFAHENYIINDRFFVDIIEDIRDSVLSTDNEKSVLFYDVNDNDYQSIFVDTNKLHNKFSGFDIFDMNPEFLVNTVVPFLLKEVAAFLNADKSDLATESALIFADRINYENEFKNQSTIVKIQRLSNLMKDIYTNGMIDPIDNHTVHLMIYTRNSNNKSSSQIVFWNPFLIKYTEYLLNTSLGKGPANDVIYILQNVFNTTSPRIMEKHSFIRYIMQTLSTNNKTGVVVMNEANKLFIYNLLNISPVQQTEYKNMQEMSRTIDRIKREKGYNTLVEIWTESRSLKKVENFLEKTLPRLDSIVDHIFNVGLSSFVNLNKVGVKFFMINESYFKSLAFGFDENDLLIKKYDRDDALKNLMTNLIDDEEEEEEEEQTTTFVYNTSSVYKLFNMKQLIGDINAQLQNAYDELELAKKNLLKKSEQYESARNDVERINMTLLDNQQKFNLEKISLQNRLSVNEQQLLQMSAKITDLNQKIREDTQLTDQQKIVLQQEKTKCENNVNDLTLENIDTKQKLLDINTKTIELQKELNKSELLNNTLKEQINNLSNANSGSIVIINDLNDKIDSMKKRNQILEKELAVAKNVANEFEQYKIDTEIVIVKLRKELIGERSKSANLTEENDRLKKPYIGSLGTPIKSNIQPSSSQPSTPERPQQQQQQNSPTKIVPPPSQQQQAKILLLSAEEQNKAIREDKKLYEEYYQLYTKNLDIKKIPQSGLNFSYENIKSNKPDKSITLAYLNRVIELLQKYRMFNTINETTTYKFKKDNDGNPAPIMSYNDYENMMKPIYSSDHFKILLDSPAFKLGPVFNYIKDLKATYESHAKGKTMDEIKALSTLLSILNNIGAPTIDRKGWDKTFIEEFSSNNSSSNLVDTLTTTTTTPTTTSISTLSMSKVATTPTPTGDTIFTPAKSVVSTLFSWDDWN